MQKNKKMPKLFVFGFAVAMSFFISAKAANAGNVFTILNPFTDPLTGFVIADAFSCSINAIWGCDSTGNPLPAAVYDITATPSTILSGESVNFSWSISNASECWAYHTDGSGGHDLSGTVSWDGTLVSGRSGSISDKVYLSTGVSMRCKNSYGVTGPEKTATVKVVWPGKCNQVSVYDDYSSVSQKAEWQLCSQGASVNKNFPSDGSAPSWQCLSDGIISPVCTATIIPRTSCILPWGDSLEAGKSVLAYQASSVACDTACKSNTLTCEFDGTISSNEVGHCTTAQRNLSDCEADDGTWIYDEPRAIYKSCSVPESCTASFECLNPEPDCTGRSGETLVGSVACNKIDISSGISTVVTPSTLCGPTCVAKTLICPSNDLNTGAWREVLP